MKILETYPETLSKKQQYALTMSPKIQRMSDNEGTVIEVSAWCVYEDEDNDGNSRRVLSILTPEGETLATNSATFMEDFKTMCDLFGPGEATPLEIISGKSKAGRTFYTCAYAGD